MIVGHHFHNKVNTNKPPVLGTYAMALESECDTNVCRTASSPQLYAEPGFGRPPSHRTTEALIALGKTRLDVFIV